QPQSSVPTEGLSPREAVELAGRIRGGSRAHVRARTTELLAALDLGEWEHKAHALSGGVARLVTFSMAAVVPGRVVILDEPTNDVDPLRRKLLWQQVRQLADGGSAVLLVTHNVLEAERCVDRLAIVDHGRVLATGTPAALKTDLGAPLRLELVLVVIQVLLAVGVVYGLSLLVPHIDPSTALYLATGAPTLTLILLGLTVVPQEVSQARVSGRHDYVVSLPVPRLAPLAAEITFWLAVQIPGTVLALVVAALRFDIGLHVSWAVAPAIALVALTGAS